MNRLPFHRKLWTIAGALAGVGLVGGGAFYLLSPGTSRGPTVDAPLAEGPRSEPPARKAPTPASFAPKTPVRSMPERRTRIQLHDVTRETGITFRHTDGSSGRHYIVETMSGGLATFDYDGDGLIDVYFVNGAPLPGTKTKADEPPRNALYRNMAGFKFKDVTVEAGVGDIGFGMGAAVGDYDNDGHQDIYVSNFGPKVLYHNNGDGTFTDATKKANVDNGNKVGAGVAFLDIDGDGDLDLYVANYVKFSFETHVFHTMMGVPMYPGPLDYSGEPGTLYRNRGDGTFTDASQESGVARLEGRGMGMICADYDNDGDTDIFVCNDAHENYLFQNDGTGKFQEVAMTAGIAYDAVGRNHANMGPDCADYDHDGWLDFYVTSYQREFATLYRGLGKGLFEDVTEQTGAGQGSFHHVKWGCGFVDFDNDGNPDLYVACGHTDDNVERWDDSTSYRARNVLLMNAGNGKFVDVSDLAGHGMTPTHASRGVAFDDLDNDGDIDVVVLNTREQPTILRNMLNESGSPNHWLQIRLRGTKTNRDGVGTRVKVVSGELSQIDEVHSGRGYQSHWGTRLHFGLGRHDRVDRIEVRWVGGGVDVLENVPVDRLLTITEGESRPQGENRLAM